MRKKREEKGSEKWQNIAEESIAAAATRQDLLKCNVSDEHDWNARVYAQVYMYHSLSFLSCAYLYVLMSHNLAFIKTKLLIIFST